MTASRSCWHRGIRWGRWREKTHKNIFFTIVASCFLVCYSKNECDFIHNLSAYGNETEKGMQCESAAARFTVMMNVP